MLIRKWSLRWILSGAYLVLGLSLMFAFHLFLFKAPHPVLTTQLIHVRQQALNYVALSLDNRLQAWTQEAEFFSRQPTLTQALIDVQGREEYLNQMLSEWPWIASAGQVAVIVWDYQLKVIGRSGDEELLRQLLELDESRFAIDGTGTHQQFFIAADQRVYYLIMLELSLNNEPEGGLAVLFPFDDFWRQLSQNNRDLFVRLLADGQPIHQFGIEDQEAEVFAHPLTEHLNAPKIILQFQVKDYALVHANQVLLSNLWIFGLVIITLVFLLNSWLVVNLLSRPMQRLNQAVKRFNSGRFDEFDLGLGGLEISELSDEFNRVSARLRVMQDKHRETLDALNLLPDGVAILNSQGCFTWINQSGSRLFGTEVGNHLLGRPYDPLLTDFTRQQFADVIIPHLQANVSWKGDIEAVNLKQEKLLLEMVYVRLLNGGIFCLFRDVKEQRQREDLAVSHQDEMMQDAFLAGRVESNQSLLHTIGNALTPLVVEIHDNLSQFRESNTVSWLENALKTLGRHRQANTLQEYLRNDQKGAKLLPFMMRVVGKLREEQQQLNQFLRETMTRMEQLTELIAEEKKPVNKAALVSSFSLEELLVNVLKILKPALDNLHINVLHSVSSDLPRLQMNRNKLMQVFLNLLINSIEAIGERSAKDATCPREIRLSVSLSSGGILNVKIEDTGIGVQPDLQDKLFHAGYSTKENATGMGLHESANTIIALGGQIRFASAGLNQGAQLRFSLPLSAKG